MSSGSVIPVVKLKYPTRCFGWNSSTRPSSPSTNLLHTRYQIENSNEGKMYRIDNLCSDRLLLIFAVGFGLRDNCALQSGYRVGTERQGRDQNFREHSRITNSTGRSPTLKTFKHSVGHTAGSDIRHGPVQDCHGLINFRPRQVERRRHLQDV